MKYDEKTGKPIPENRRDEIELSLNAINDIRKKTNGFNDKQTEISQMLADINMTNAMIFDVLAMIFNNMVKSKNEEDEGVEKDDECSAESP